MNDNVSGKMFAMALANLGVFFIILECWHQFRDASGWSASGWFALMIAAWVVAIVGNKILAKMRG